MRNKTRLKAQLVLENHQQTPRLITVEPSLEFNYGVVEELYRRGNELLNRHAYDEALLVFNEIVRLRLSSPEAWNDLAIVYALLGRHADAERNFESALAHSMAANVS